MRARHMIFILITVVALVACATGPTVNLAGVPVPTYKESVGATLVSQHRSYTSCPRDATSWQKHEWRKLIPLANACAKSGDWRRVDDIGQHLSVQAHSTPWGPYYLSLSASARKDYPRAVWLLQLAQKKAPKEGLLHYQLGRIYWEMEDEVGALKEFTLASDLNSDLTEAHWVVGQAALHSGNHSEAEKRLGRALSNDSRHWPALMAMASLKSRTNNWSEAERYLARAISLNPRSSSARLALAEIQEKHLSRPKDALRNYKDLRQLASDKKLDDRVAINLDEKIRVMEGSIKPVVAKENPSRKPAATNKKKGKR